MALFGLGKKPTTFGLDIGTSAVKLVELAQSKGGLALKSFASVPLPRDVIAEGTIREPQVVSDAIKECIEKAGVSGTSAVISVSGREAIVKRVPLPKVTAKELGDAIQLEAEHHIPFAIDDVFLDYQVVSQSANAMSVVLVATKKVKVLEYVAAVEAAGLDAVVVDLDAFATNLRAYTAAGLTGAVVCGSTGEAALLDEEERRSLIERARQELSGDAMLIV